MNAASGRSARLKRALHVPRGYLPRKIPLGLGRGLTMELDLEHQLGMYLGTYEMELTRFWHRICRPGYTAFDCGSNQGYHALAIARRTGAAVHAFEPNETALDLLRRNLKRNADLSGLVTVQEAYVGARHADGVLPTTTLDAVAYGPSALFVPDLVKIDIEGAEAEALAGAAELLCRRRPHLIIETHSAPLERKCLSLLADCGYAPVIKHQRTVAREGRSDVHNRWILGLGTDR